VIRENSVKKTAVRPNSRSPTTITPPNSPAAQALVAGLLQGLGERYGDERLKVEGEKLARGERCGAAVADQRCS